MRMSTVGVPLVEYATTFPSTSQFPAPSASVFTVYQVVAFTSVTFDAMTSAV